ncbi:Membrane carboxypeptidase [Crenothrix polyspora]|uniref:peptidoglycan glycosyltransferase n=1 Tax=Crenothrix polyspora TaxID=360316 RepID=A0A1R4H021_9GAMM|nr:transglycosylase domain-containing protein [Crenothrix polyspora]SJM89597.1 Membrane carboxypeptidase [Crenothrix polyspora]
MQKDRISIGHYLTIYIILGLVVVAFMVVKLVREEVATSKYQARYLSEISRQLSFSLDPGPSTSIRYPGNGPYDLRMGYASLPEMLQRLQKSGYSIAAQAKPSPKMIDLMDSGLFAIYHEKTQAGLHIVDRTNQPVFANIYPEHGYPDFAAIPPIILNTLLYIENRELLSQQNVTINPAVEWDRLGFASLQMIAHKFGLNGNVPGGSTLATQIEKYRHSPNGFTNSLSDKFRQMSSASIRAYLLGPNTLEMRREIAHAYLNSMPLAATPKVGEVHGLGDGLDAWFSADFAEVNRLLSADALKATEQITPQQAQAYRQVLSILLSQRRPSYLLGRGYNALQTLADSYLRLLASQGVISTALRDAALKVKTVRLPHSDKVTGQFMVEKKTQSVLRTRLAKALGTKSNYELDRLDLTAKTTLDYKTQQAVTAALRLLNDPKESVSAGLYGKRMLSGNIDLSPIVYSLMLFERTDQGNMLRIQTDSFDQPLDINEGIRIDLGSTSKLRTLVHYLEILAELHKQYKDRPVDELKKLQFHPRDYLSAWVREHLLATPHINLQDLLNEALERKYSASPYEGFYTGGGVHHFNNFDKSDNGRIITVRHALRNSVNLVFIRMMRDIVYHHMYKPGGMALWLDNPDDPRQKEYLERFADREARVYLQRFYAKYQGKSPAEALKLLSQKVLAKPSRLTMLYQAIYPDHDVSQLNQFLSEHVAKVDMNGEDIYELYDKYSPRNFDLQDQGYIVKIHPLELWLVSYLAKNPGATKEDVIAASTRERLDVYRWLLKSNRKHGQQRRIMTLLEEEAFKKVHAAWRRVGYPFDRLTASYATSIGASGDRPAALAELMGIIRNDGVKMPSVRFESLHFAENTPYETVMNKSAEKGERIFPAEVAISARSALAGVVEEGTASRLRGVYTDVNGKPLVVGGKTGTGDHRKQVWGERGRLIESKFISRAAVFTFFLGEHFYGVMTAYVEGPNAGQYHFTSSLPVQIVKFLKPVLMPLINKTSATPTPIAVKVDQPLIADAPKLPETSPVPASSKTAIVKQKNTIKHAKPLKKMTLKSVKTAPAKSTTLKKAVAEKSTASKAAPVKKILLPKTSKSTTTNKTPTNTSKPVVKAVPSNKTPGTKTQSDKVPVTKTKTVTAVTGKPPAAKKPKPATPSSKVVPAAAN